MGVTNKGTLHGAGSNGQRLFDIQEKHLTPLFLPLYFSLSLGTVTCKAQLTILLQVRIIGMVTTLGYCCLAQSRRLLFFSFAIWGLEEEPQLDTIFGQA